MADSAKEDAKRLNLSAATFHDFVEELDELDTAKNRIIAKIRNKRKQAKDAGINLGAMDEALKAKRMDPDDRKALEEDRLKYAKWLGVDLGFQASLDLPEPTPADQERITKFDAHKQGYASALRGDPHSGNPHEVGTVAHVAFKMGWDDGNNDVFNGAAPKPKPRKVKKGAGPEVTGPQPEAAEETVPEAANGAGEDPNATPPAEAAPADPETPPEGTTID